MICQKARIFSIVSIPFCIKTSDKIFKWVDSGFFPFYFGTLDKIFKWVNSGFFPFYFGTLDKIFKWVDSGFFPFCIKTSDKIFKWVDNGFFPFYFGTLDKIFKWVSRAQWSEQNLLDGFSLSNPHNSKYSGCTFFGNECLIYRRSKRSRGLKRPGISRLSLRCVSQVYSASRLLPVSSQMSYTLSGSPPPSTNWNINKENIL